MQNYPVSGVGLGLRRGLVDTLKPYDSSQINFMEVAPENWINVGGAMGKKFRSYTERFDFMSHGLSLSLGSPAPLDVEFIKSVKSFLKDHGIKAYSEHLSYCGDHGGHMYDLMPIPFTEESIKYVAKRIKQVQDIIEDTLIVENVSTYAEPDKQMQEIEFLNAVLEEADCHLLLDVNNVYVNSINHGFDCFNYIDNIPAERIKYIHVAGHYEESDNLLVDTHGAPVKNDVWELLKYTYTKFGVIPTLLERDFNLPPIEELMAEINMIKQLQVQGKQAHAQQIA